MNMETIIRVPLNEKVFNSFLYCVNEKDKEEYIVKRSEVLKNFTPFLSDTERQVIEGEKWINYVVFYVDKSM